MAGIDRADPATSPCERRPGPPARRTPSRERFGPMHRPNRQPVRCCSRQRRKGSSRSGTSGTQLPARRPKWPRPANPTGFRHHGHSQLQDMTSDRPSGGAPLAQEQQSRQHQWGWIRCRARVRYVVMSVPKTCAGRSPTLGAHCHRRSRRVDVGLIDGAGPAPLIVEPRAQISRAQPGASQGYSWDEDPLRGVLPWAHAAEVAPCSGRGTRGG